MNPTANPTALRFPDKVNRGALRPEVLPGVQRQAIPGAAAALSRLTVGGVAGRQEILMSQLEVGTDPHGPELYQQVVQILVVRLVLPGRQAQCP